MEHFFPLFKKYGVWVLMAAILVSAFSFGISLIQTPKYKASVKVLIIQKQANRMDAYTASRSAQAVGEVLSRVIYTSSFFDQVMASGFKINREQFSKDAEKRKKEWKEMVSARVVDETGTVQIDVFHPDPKQAEQIAYGIVYVMVTNGSQYHGGGEQIEIKMIDAPTVSKKPVKPDIWQNTFGGFVFGLLIATSLVALLATRNKEVVTKEKRRAKPQLPKA